MGTSGAGHQLSMACGLGDLHGLSSPLSFARIGNPLIVEAEGCLAAVYTGRAGVAPSLSLSSEPWFWGCGQTNLSCKMVKGKLVEAGKWPWQVSILFLGMYICSGSVIHHQWVLTAAHCLERENVTYSVRVGSPWIDQKAQTTADVRVHQVILNSQFRAHRYWSWVGQANNIALLQLERTLTYSKYVWPICLPGLDYRVKDFSLCTVTGWGLPRANGTWPQFRTIREKEVTIMNSKQCEDFYHRFSKIPSLVRVINSQMICVQDTDRKHFCYETSGEPLSCPVQDTWFLVGIVSWGPGCGQNEAPPIYLRISTYQHWIWKRINGQPLPAPSRALLLALSLPLSLLAAC
ncbi:probable threonine protease PRSS50 [Myotis lucifugus]|uniref:probable threonine protease PRSS50 n=1 Tax=Myotis lucifugus TaxID=59463 RepID=UPI0003C47D7E|nr:probable threonine protease PRSS50 [Myotis lucifugus]